MHSESSHVLHQHARKGAGAPGRAAASRARRWDAGGEPGSSRWQQRTLRTLPFLVFFVNERCCNILARSSGAVPPACPSEAAELTCWVQRNAPLALEAVAFSAAALPPAGQCGGGPAAGDASQGKRHLQLPTPPCDCSWRECEW